MDTLPLVTSLVMVGACYIDTILSVPSFPQEDDKLRATSLQKRRGGNVANSLEVLEQLLQRKTNTHLDLHLLCVLPNRSSPATRFVKDSFGPKVDLSLCMYRENHEEAASSYIIKGMDKGSRTIVNYNDLPEMTLEEFQRQISHNAGNGRTMYHFEGRIPEITVACMRWLRREYPGDVLLSVEVEKPRREGLMLMAEEADVVFFAKSWAKAAGYHNVGEFLKFMSTELRQANLLCCTWGEEGAAIIDKAGLYHHQPAFIDPKRQVVDTVGAGDTFVAGMLFELLTSPEADIRGTVVAANELAGRKVLQEGFANLASSSERR